MELFKFLIKIMILFNDLIFYETENEVNDIDLTILIEAGGTLTSSWFSWIKNQLCINGNFESTSGWSYERATLSVTNNKATLSTNSSGTYISLYRHQTFIAKHNYLISFTLTNSKADKYSIRLLDSSYAVAKTVANNVNIGTARTTISYIANVTSDIDNGFLFIYPYQIAVSAGDTSIIENVQIIDLTVGFGAGKEPANINDPVIKEILRLGYIPTDVSGTLTNVDSKVLPDIDCKIKCK